MPDQNPDPAAGQQGSTAPSAGGAVTSDGTPVQDARQIFGVAAGELTGEEIYNRIMGEIEPDLTTTARDTLDTKYKDETPQKRQARLDRYNKAFEEYEKRYRQYMDDLASKTQALQRSLRQSFEDEARRDDDIGLSSIESAMSAA